MTKLPKTIAYKGYDIPTGKTDLANKKRAQIITDFYKEWFGNTVERKVKNDRLDQFIHVDNFSMKETRNWARLSHRSTLTVLELSYVLKHAVKTEVVPTKDNKSQSRFNSMLIMECIVPQLRPYVNVAKLMVGVAKHKDRKWQYCLTAK